MGKIQRHAGGEQPHHCIDRFFNGQPRFLAHIFLGLPVAGIALCGLWFLLTRRSFDNYLYWISSARELEGRYLHPTVKTVSRGADFADGLPTDVALGDKIQVLRMSRLGRTIRAAWIAYSAIIVFVGLCTLFIIDSW
jgi:hypothetical protein